MSDDRDKHIKALRMRLYILETSLIPAAHDKRSDDAIELYEGERAALHWVLLCWDAARDGAGGAAS